MRCRVVARASVIVRRVVVVEPLVRTRLALRRRAIHEGVPVVLRRTSVSAPVAVRAPRCGVVLASRAVLARLRTQVFHKCTFGCLFVDTVNVRAATHRHHL